MSTLCFHAAFVCRSACLSVRLDTTVTRGPSVDKEKLIKFWQSNTCTGILWKILQDILRWGVFHNVSHTSKQTKWIFIKKNITDVSLAKKEPVKFWMSSGSRLWIRTPDMDSGSGLIHLGGSLQVITANYICFFLFIFTKWVIGLFIDVCSGGAIWWMPTGL